MRKRTGFEDKNFRSNTVLEPYLSYIEAIETQFSKNKISTRTKGRKWLYYIGKTDRCCLPVKLSPHPNPPEVDNDFGRR